MNEFCAEPTSASLLCAALLFSQIANAEAWLAEVAAGNLDHSDPVAYQESEALVPVLLFRLPAGGEVELLGEALKKVAVSPVRVVPRAPGATDTLIPPGAAVTV